MLFLLISCEKRGIQPFVIWTDNPALVFCTELFNEQQDDFSAFLVYKENPAASLPPGDGEETPDLIIGSYLKNSQTRRLFSSLDYLFEAGTLNDDIFLPNALDFGKIAARQYLIPVSFNLPMVIFSAGAEDLTEAQSTVTIEHIREAASAFNEKNEHDEFTRMGFAPAWDEDFLYLATRLKGASYSQKGRSFVWDAASLNAAVSYLKDWSVSDNGGPGQESDFQFKYLYMPKRMQVTRNRSLFAYAQSSEFFVQDQSLISDLSFRWIGGEDALMAEDDTVCLGLYRKSKRKSAAVEFISWLFSQETQAALLERMSGMNINTKSFGIAGGFSTVTSVNEDVFPVYYRGLLGNLPPMEEVEFANLLPMDWNVIKEDIIYPYLRDSYASEQGASLEERISRSGRRVY